MSQAYVWGFGKPKTNLDVLRDNRAQECDYRAH